MLVPLYGFMKGDTLGILILVRGAQNVSAIAATLQEATIMRIAPSSYLSVYFEGQRLNPNWTITQAGLGPLDRVDVVPEAPDESQQSQ